MTAPAVRYWLFLIVGGALAERSTNILEDAECLHFAVDWIKLAEDADRRTLAVVLHWR